MTHSPQPLNCRRMKSQLASVLMLWCVSGTASLFAGDGQSAGGAFTPPAPVAPPPGADVPAGQRTLLDDNWSMSVTPNEGQPKIDPRDYQRIYQSIPFRRSEYLANPSYRHDTTVEILFGQMRPTVIQRNDTPQRVVNRKPVFTQPYRFTVPEYMEYLRSSRLSLGFLNPFAPSSLMPLP